MFGKNAFRTFLYLVAAIVLVKLCYNLGYGIANRRLSSTTQGALPKTNARRQAEAPPGMTIDPADSVEAAQSGTSTQ